MHPLRPFDEADGLDKVGVFAPFGPSQRCDTRLSRGAHNMRKRESIVTSIVPLLSHDIRHHLSVVLCNAEFMSESATLETDRKQLFEEVTLAIKHMTDLLDLMHRDARSESPPAASHGVIQRPH